MPKSAAKFKWLRKARNHETCVQVQLFLNFLSNRGRGGRHVSTSQGNSSSAMAMANENFDTGGTGGAIFGGPQGGAPVKAPGPTSQPMGDEYVAPKGLPNWKQPSYDEDDRVDPAKYPEPKSGPAATLLTRCFPDPTQGALAVAKVFYFFFYAAFGSLFPLMGVYFKQIGMDAAQTGFLSGIRPIVEALAIPFWNNIASRLHKGKF